MWEIYDKLIEGIPESWTAESIVRGSAFAYVKSQGGVGLGGLVNYDMRMPLYTKNLEGLPLREVAQCIKSWNFYEASVGLAAINAYYNCPEIARSSGVPLGESRHVEDRIYDPFIMSQNEIRGRKVTVIGHFPFIETLFQPICDIRVIAGEIPLEGDYPVSAAEYLLPDSEYIYIGSSCLVEKTLPRLLELSCNAVKVTLVGPSTTLAPVLFEYGVHDLSGYVVKDGDRAMRMVRGAENGKIYSTGQKVSLKRK
ncbi:MAG: hypothetical protein K0R19_656 [Bacillota bacterium]|jgi:uncharacterized protein (DUF4213/DUF364 family)|nr:hypothetical protein [Bacillota bacterium]